MERGQNGWINLVTDGEMAEAGLARAEIKPQGEMLFERDPPLLINPNTVGEVMDGLVNRLAREDITDDERQAAQAFFNDLKSMTEPEA
jgi:hypothetical protein